MCLGGGEGGGCGCAEEQGSWLGAGVDLVSSNTILILC